MFISLDVKGDAMLFCTVALSSLAGVDRCNEPLLSGVLSGDATKPIR